MAIRFPRLGDGFPRRFAPRNDSLTLSVIIPYNGKVRQESLQFREPMTAGVVLFTKSSREGHDFAAIILYPMLVPNEMTYLFVLPLLFSNTHRQKTLTHPGQGLLSSWDRGPAFTSLRGAQRRGNPSPASPQKSMFTKNSFRRHDSAAIIRYSIRVPGSVKIYAQNCLQAPAE